MSDLVERLREVAALQERIAELEAENVRGSFVIPIEAPDVFGWADEAADEIERLRAALNEIAETDIDDGLEMTRMAEQALKGADDE